MGKTMINTKCVQVHFRSDQDHSVSTCGYSFLRIRIYSLRTLYPIPALLHATFFFKVIDNSIPTESHCCCLGSSSLAWQIK